MKTLLLLIVFVLVGCALPQKPTAPISKADRIEGCIGRLTDVTGADAMQVFEICRQMHRLRKVD